jgi:hypothetical protein
MASADPEFPAFEPNGDADVLPGTVTDALVCASITVRERHAVLDGEPPACEYDVWFARRGVAFAGIPVRRRVITWEVPSAAPPLRKGPAICHGTAGNGFALLRLAQRSGDARWRGRAERFALHAMRQTVEWHAAFGMPSVALWTGGLGVALFVDAVLADDPALLSLDKL